MMIYFLSLQLCYYTEDCYTVLNPDDILCEVLKLRIKRKITYTHQSRAEMCPVFILRSVTHKFSELVSH